MKKAEVSSKISIAASSSAKKGQTAISSSKTTSGKGEAAVITDSHSAESASSIGEVLLVPLPTVIEETKAIPAKADKYQAEKKLCSLPEGIEVEEAAAKEEDEKPLTCWDRFREYSINLFNHKRAVTVNAIKLCVGWIWEVTILFLFAFISKSNAEIDVQVNVGIQLAALAVMLILSFIVHTCIKDMGEKYSIQQEYLAWQQLKATSDNNSNSSSSQIEKGVEIEKVNAEAVLVMNDKAEEAKQSKQEDDGELAQTDMMIEVKQILGDAEQLQQQQQLVKKNSSSVSYNNSSSQRVIPTTSSPFQQSS